MEIASTWILNSHQALLFVLRQNVNIASGKKNVFASLLNLIIFRAHFILRVTNYKNKKTEAHAQQGLNAFKLIAQSRGCRENVQLWAAAAEPASGLYDNRLM